MSADAPGPTLRLAAPAPALPPTPEPACAVLGAAARPHAAIPALEFDIEVTEPTGRHVYAIDLRVQVMIEPARRTYDAATRDRLVELFGPPERWAATTRSLVWHRADVLVPAFTGRTTTRLPIPVSFDQEVAAAKYLYALPDGAVPLAFNCNGTIHYRGDDGRLQMSLVPWSCSAGFRLPVATWRALIDDVYPGTGWIALRRETLDALLGEKARRGSPSLDACVADLLGGAR